MMEKREEVGKEGRSKERRRTVRGKKEPGGGAQTPLNKVVHAWGEKPGTTVQHQNTILVTSQPLVYSLIKVVLIPNHFWIWRCSRMYSRQVCSKMAAMHASTQAHLHPFKYFNFYYSMDSHTVLN